MGRDQRERSFGPLRVEEEYTFDDVLLLPGYSPVKSREDPDISIELGSLKLGIPIISAPMNTVTEIRMGQFMSGIGGSAAIHRFMDTDVQISHMGASEPVNFAAVGVTNPEFERVKKLLHAGQKNILVDVAHGHSKHVMDAVVKIRELLGSEGNLMAGNICTYEGALELLQSGANIIRVGIGPGSACTTRIVTGHGRPQLSAISAVAMLKNHHSFSLVADGGIRNSGDIIKALAAGADAVMVGGLLAGTDEAPGKLLFESGHAYKFFAGMASEYARKQWYSGTQNVVEGESFKVPYKGPAGPILKQLEQAIKTGMSISGAMTLEELRKNATWVKVTDNGRKEGTANRRMHRL